MRPPGVVLAPLHLEEPLGFLECIEDLTVEQFVLELAVELFTVGVLPSTA